MKLQGKHDLILNICKNKSILHIGACDSPFTKERFDTKELLHLKINKVSKKCIGIDISRENIKYLNNNNINNIGYGNIITGNYEIDLSKEKFDCIILGDVIEHLDNPGVALNNLKKIMIPGKTVLVVTTPNVFGYSNIKTFFTGNEVVHPDHTFWPSYKTMKRLFSNNGLKIKDFKYCLSGSIKHIKTIKGRLFYKFILKKLPYLSPVLYFEFVI